MRTAVIIPARIGSERLARKALRLIDGISLTERVWRQVVKAKGIDDVYVATDSDEILSHVMQFGGNAIMTEISCKNGTERVCQAMDRLEAKYDVVINVQGDEPLIVPDVIEAVAKAFSDKAVTIATPVSPLREVADLSSPSVVKCAIAQDNRILYFSRSAIPHVRDTANTVRNGLHWKHIGVYGFRSTLLMQLTSLPPSALEESEKLEQLRWLENGFTIHAVQVNYDSVAVDTESDVVAVEEILAKR
jgi:3-deoxy-manno-octulosonate cytidylyltransferase (CMP-KDO synthetase)